LPFQHPAPHGSIAPVPFPPPPVAWFFCVTPGFIRAPGLKYDTLLFSSAFVFFPPTRRALSFRTAFPSAIRRFLQAVRFISIPDYFFFLSFCGLDLHHARYRASHCVCFLRSRRLQTFYRRARTIFFCLFFIRGSSSFLFVIRLGFRLDFPLSFVAFTPLPALSGWRSSYALILGVLFFFLPGNHETVTFTGSHLSPGCLSNRKARDPQEFSCGARSGPIPPSVRFILSIVRLGGLVIGPFFRRRQRFPRPVSLRFLLLVLYYGSARPISFSSGFFRFRRS